jgi:cation diffusion facilitator CzcD-associated flavoprotein CzcO
MGLDIGRRRLARAVGAARREGRALPRVVIVGGGLSGLAAAAQLVRAGLRTFTVIEQSDGVGGTWRDNTYPGSACDVPSHLYSFSFFPKSDWSRRFAGQPEILGYAEACVDRFGLDPHLRLSTTVERATFDERDGRWHLEVHSPEGPEELVADTVIFACGQLNRPAVPDLAGLDGFAGRWWHSARWDHSVDLTGARVGVVGSGASAIQFVPPVADRAAEVTIYQRSPNYVAPKKDHAYPERTRTLFMRSAALSLAYRWWIYWTLELRWLMFRRDSWAGRKVTERFSSGLRDAVVSERLPDATVVPDYPVGCKRILISNEWYPTLMRPAVTVTRVPIDHIEPDAVVTADGLRHPTDVLIFGTGFSTTDFLAHVEVVGEGGATLSGAWREGAHAYLGTAVPGFPNCYLLYGPNTNLGHNSILFMVERQLNLVLQGLALQTGRLVTTPGAEVAPRIGVTESAYRRDDERTQRLMSGTAWVGTCHSWYKEASGRVTNNWPTWTLRFWRETLFLDRRVLRSPGNGDGTDRGPVGSGALAGVGPRTPSADPDS